MEAKIMEILERIENKFEQVDKRFDEIEKMIIRENAKLKEELRTEFKQENAKLKEELRTEFKQENAKLKEELRTEFKQENAKLKKEISEKITKECKKVKEEIEESVRKQILDHMFVFEVEYGRKLTIAFEELTSRSNKEKIQDDSIANLKRMSDLHTAYTYNHEDRIDKLEKIKL